MIAIAGAKGGCGKTTTTLGLAEGFARSGTPALAVDADRQLPNLHVVAGVDREPTLGTIADGTDVLTTAQEHPGSPDVGILPAPKSSERVDVESTLDRIELDSVQTLIDCPSGAGPDVVDAMSAADGVLVVTTGGERSLEAAKTTVEMANRLGIPILGTVVNDCESVPESIESWVDVPLLGRVPSAESPLTSEETRSAYDEIVNTLQTRNVTRPTPHEYADDLLPTGINALDRRLNGGFPPGTVVALTADPATQAEQLLYEMTSSRGTLYLTTRRSVQNVTRAIESSTLETGNPTIRRIDEDDRIDHAKTLIGKIPDGANLIVDSASVLEQADQSPYDTFLNELKDTMVDTGSVAVLYCPSISSPPDNRTATLYHADVVLDLNDVSPGVGSTIEHYLSVRKHRANSGFSETIELSFDSSSDPVTVTPTTGSQ